MCDDKNRLRPLYWPGKRRDPADYDGSLVCARCGSGWPVCADIDGKTGQHYSHELTCAKYDFGRDDMDICLKCSSEIKADYGGLDSTVDAAPCAGGDD